jgi:ribonuclease HI
MSECIADTLPTKNADYYKFLDDVDYYLFTDGSGYTDGIGGSCAVIHNVAEDETQTVIAAKSKTTVPREEMQALLNGLAHIYNNDKRTGLCIRWFSDCEALVKSVNNEYGRGKNKDQWCAFDFYEQRYDIEANHVLRDNDIPYMSIADLHASSMRQWLKSYIESI